MEKIQMYRLIESSWLGAGKTFDTRLQAEDYLVSASGTNRWRQIDFDVLIEEIEVLAFKLGS